MRIFDFSKPDIEKLKKKRDVDGLIKAMGSSNKDVQNDAIKALEGFGELVVEPLRHALEDYDSDIRFGAAEALGNIKQDGIVILRGGLVKFANKRVFEITGFSRYPIVGKQFVDFVSPRFKEKVLERYRKRISYEWAPHSYEIEIISKNQGDIPVEINASLIEYEGRPADLVIIKVIEGQKRG